MLVAVEISSICAQRRSWAAEPAQASVQPGMEKEEPVFYQCPLQTRFFGLSFGAGAEVYGKENDWEQKTEGEDRFRDVTSNLKVWHEPFSLSMRQPQGDLVEATIIHTRREWIDGGSSA